MAASGFTFGNTAASTKPAFSFGTPASNTNTLSGFGASTNTGFSFGAPKTTTTSATGFTFGGTSTAPTATSASTGFSFGTPAATTSASTGFGGGLFGAKTTVATTSGTGFSLFGNKTTTTASTTGLGFGTPATSKTGFLNFPGATGTTSSLGFGSSIATSTASSNDKTPENVKDAIVPAELKALVDNIEKYIKNQKEIKDEISKISSEQISKTREQLKELKQAVALISNALQRNSIAVENLKSSVNQELKNGEICHRSKQIAGSFQHDFSTPIQYFQRLVFSFESRISSYRQELEELEAFLTSTSPMHDFSPQDLSNIFKRLNDAFVALASELYQVHEQIKVLKEKYLHFRRVFYGDASDPFAARKKSLPPGMHKTLGPSPFPVVQGAGIMASAFKTEQKGTTAATLPKLNFGSTSFNRPTGLTRSFSFDGSSKKTSGQGSLSAGGSLFVKPTLGVTPSLNTTGTFTLQQPPTGKRGRIF